MHIEMNNPKPADELVEQVGPVLAQHYTDEAVKNEKPQLAVAQEFQERVIAPLNEQGLKGADGIGQCVFRADHGVARRIFEKHAAEIAADPRKFFLVTVPKKYPHLGLKPKYRAPSRIFSPGKLMSA